MSWGSWWKSLFPRRSIVAPPPRRLDGRSKMLLSLSTPSRCCPKTNRVGSRAKRPSLFFRRWTVNMRLAKWTKSESKILQASHQAWVMDVYWSLFRSRTGPISFAKQADPDRKKPLVGIKAIMRANAGGYLTRKKPALVRCLP
jgi:hypothetical protein